MTSTFSLFRARTLGFTSMCLLLGATSIHAQGTATMNDPRVGLKPGLTDAGWAAKGMTLLSHSPKADSLGANAPLGGLTFANSDLAFSGNTVVQGNFSGFIAWDVSNPARPVMRKAVVCPTDQGDPTIVGHLLFISDETTRGRVNCGSQPFTPADSVSGDRARGVRVFDISDINNPRQITVVQTCRGSHTHTLVQDPRDKNNVYIYVSGSAGVRSPNELKGCSDAMPDSNPNSSRFRIDVIKVPLAHPEQARVVSSPRLFDSLMHATAHGLSPADTAGGVQPRGGRGAVVRNLPANLQMRAATTAVDSARITKTVDSLKAAGFTINIVDGVATMMPPAGGRGAGRGRAPRIPMGPEQCHDITVYPAIGLGAGACGQYGLLLDLSNPANPKRVAAVSDTNFSFWHSATFNNDGTKLLFTDEWGGGTQPKCRAGDPINWGGDALFTLDKKTRKLTPGAYYKIPQVQTSQENCVAHNGGLVPVPGRDILVQGWYQGGVSMMDFTDVNHPKEIAYFDRGPVSDTMLVIGGFWGAYFYNGHIYASEIARGFDVFDLTPTDQLSQNEIDAAKLVHFDQLNPQDQPKIVWPAAFPVVRSYLDQLTRENGLTAARTSHIAADLSAAEKATGAKRASALNKLASALDKDAATSTDAAKVRAMAAATRDLAKASR